MVQTITCAVNSNNSAVLQQFIKRLSISGIKAHQGQPSEKYTYLQLIWDDADIPRHKNAGAKPKKLQYEGKTATCAFVYWLRNEKKLSDAEIASLYDVSESTISRRRKKHMENGCFHEDSTAIF